MTIFPSHQRCTWSRRLRKSVQELHPAVEVLLAEEIVAFAEFVVRRGAHVATGSSQRTRRGSPRSGNGISIVSKSRGSTVRSNTARASSRISRPP